MAPIHLRDDSVHARATEQLPPATPFGNAPAGARRRPSGVAPAPADRPTAASFSWGDALRNGLQPPRAPTTMALHRHEERIPSADELLKPLQAGAGRHGLVRLCPRPGSATLHHVPPELEDIMLGDVVSLQRITAGHLGRLSDAALRTLLAELAQTRHRSAWHTAALLSNLLPCSLRLPHHRVLSGTSVLFLELMVQGEAPAAVTVLRHRPTEVTAELAPVLPHLFTLEVMQDVLAVALPATTNPADNDPAGGVELVDAMGRLIAAFFEVRSPAGHKLVGAYTAALVKRFENGDFDRSSANVGLLVGITFAGGCHYFKTRDERYAARQRAVTSIAAVLFAATTFLPNDLVVKSLQLASVLVSVGFIYFWQVRDDTPSVRRLQGDLKAQLTRSKSFREQFDVAEAFCWIDVALNCNGFA